MSKRNKMVNGMFIGAALGAAITLLDKETRDSFVGSSKRLGRKVVEVVKSREEIVSTLKENVNQIRTTIEQVTDDIRYFSGKMNELNETTPQMIEMLVDAKEILTKPHKNKEEFSEIER